MPNNNNIANALASLPEDTKEVLVNQLTANNAIMNTATTMGESPLVETSNYANYDSVITNSLENIQIPRKTKPLVRNYAKIGRNDLCPCGSGKKYKNCCMNSGEYDGYTEYGKQLNPYDKQEETTEETAA